MEQIFQQLTASFDLALMISITIITYLTLKILDKLVYKSSKVLKKIITSTISITLCIVFFYYAELTIKQIVPTYLLSVAFYDYIIKYLINYLKIGYKK